MKHYIDLVKNILENGSERNDRTGIGSKFVSGATLKFDLSEGFPMITTRKVSFRIAFEETMFFLRGQTDTKILEEKNINIWKGNTSREFLDSRGLTHLPVGSIGRGYSHLWRQWDTGGNEWMSKVVLIKQGAETGNNTPYHIDIPLEQVDYTQCDDFVGKIFKTKTDGDIIVLKKLPTKSGNTHYKIQFLSGIRYIRTAGRPEVRSGGIRNVYRTTMAGGCRGTLTHKSLYLRDAYILWRNMMERCHGNDVFKTINYKQRGVFVDSEWRCFTNFYNDIHFLPGFDNWKTNPRSYQLDKDYFGNNFYGRKSSIFLPRKYNEDILNKPTVDGRLYIAENKKTNEVFKFTAPYFFNKHTGTSGVVDRAFLRQNAETQIWKFKKVLPPPGFKWRQQFYIDQMSNLLNGIQDSPNDRRHIVTAWDPTQLSGTPLPPCHLLQMYTVDTQTNRLNSSFVMRSTDVYLGLPTNIMGYAFLNMVFAELLGYEPGELTYFGWDAHLYMNQLDVAAEQITRTPKTLPKLYIKPEIKLFDDVLALQYKDIVIEDYDPHPALSKVDMAI